MLPLVLTGAMCLSTAFGGTMGRKSSASLTGISGGGPGAGIHMGTAPSDSTAEETREVLTSCTVTEADLTENGSVRLPILKKDLTALGVKTSDYLSIAVGNGTAADYPLCADFSDVDDNGAALFAAGEEDIVLWAVKNGSLSDALSLKEKISAAGGSLTLTFYMDEPGGYLGGLALHHTEYSANRADYPGLSDAAFANFRMVGTTGMGSGKLYRGASPVCPTHGRNSYADAAFREAGVTVLIDLSDDEAALTSWPAYASSVYSGAEHTALGMGTRPDTADYRQKLAEGLRFIGKHPGTYGIHCVEGKVRTGFVCAVLEGLMGAAPQEIAADYMMSYTNYNGITPGHVWYEPLLKDTLYADLETAFGIEDFTVCDPAKEAEEYLREIGLSAEEIEAIKKNLM